MKQIYFTLLLLFACTYAFAQQDFRAGYIILQGDTVQGLVDYRGDKRSAQLVTYKATQESAQQQYTPADIMGYGFLQEQKIFETKALPTIDSVSAPKRVFLNALIKGQASIYVYSDENKKERFYLLKEGEQLTELKIIKRTERQDNGRQYQVEQKIYQNLLVHAFSDCPGITQKQFERLKLGKKELIAITQKYNACVGNSTFIAKPDESNVSYGIALFYTASALQFSAPGPHRSGDAYLNGRTFKEKSPRVGAALSINITPLPLNKNLSLQAELLYDPSRFSMKFNGPEDSKGLSDTYETSFDLAFVKLPVQVRYVYPLGKFRPFLNLGGLTGHAFRREHETTATRFLAGKYHTITTPAFPNKEFKELVIGVTGGAGISYELYGKPIFLEARVEKTNGISDQTSLSSKMNTFYLILKYTL